MVLGLVEQASLQMQLKAYLDSKCGEDNRACLIAVDVFIGKLLDKAPPDEICKSDGLAVCPNQCTLYTKWPVKLPEEPIEWPTQRRQLYDSENMAPIRRILLDSFGDSLIGRKDYLPIISKVAVAVAKLLAEVKKSSFSMVPVKGTDIQYDSCGHNVTCHIEALVDHEPLVDGDGDRFAPAVSQRMRGTDWRGFDCDDKASDVYPGRLVTNYDADIDHNCNGIMGSNETDSYENIFCKNYPGRGSIFLGDSATAHFHIPPQWVTAQGWNIDGLVPILENEFDSPQCRYTSFSAVMHFPDYNSICNYSPSHINSISFV
jgi:hypothetical protein